MTGTIDKLVAESGSRRASSTDAVARWVVALLVVSAVVLGIGMRAWYLLHDPIDADQALIGILARQILGGHFHAFLLGQHYGGVEPYLVAGVFGIFGSSPLTLGIAVLVCEVAACLLTWRTALRLSRRADVAAICAAAMWVAPQSAVWNSTMEYGFRGVTLVCGTAMLLVSLRLYQGSVRWWDLPLLGAFAGVGWWSSPEIVYFAVPSAVWAAGWFWRSRRASPRARFQNAWGIAGGVACIGIGALPWLWDNVADGFPSLSVSKYDSPAVVPSYASRLGVFFHDALPMVLDLRVPRSGAWIMPAPFGVAILVVLGAGAVAALAWQLWLRADGAPVALGVLAYPFVLAVVPASVAWQSGRYTNFLVPLLALLAAATLGELAAPRRPEPAHRAGRRHLHVVSFASVLMAALIATSIVAFADLEAINVLEASRLGSSPNAPARSLAAALERDGIRGGYADYWVAYKLDFLAAGRLQVTDAPPSPDRVPAVRAAAHALPARQQAWIFVAPTPTARTEYADTPVIRGPSGLPLGTFLADLSRLGVGYEVLHLAGGNAVVCRRPVVPKTVGL